MLVVGDPVSLNSRDMWMRDRLIAGGWTAAVVIVPRRSHLGRPA